MRLLPLLVSLALSTAAAASHASAVDLSGNLLVNGDFENSNVSYNGYKYIDYPVTPVVSAAGWVFAGASGVANHASAWGGAATTSSVVFLQSYPGSATSTLSQVFSGPFSSLDISFNLAQRPGNQESLRVMLDGLDLTPSLLTPAGSIWTSYSLTASNLNSRSHTLTFIGVNPTNSNDSSLFIDNIVVNATVPEPGSLALVGAALAAFGFMRRRLAGYAS